MGRKEIFVSDLTDQEAKAPRRLEELIVVDHPEYGEVVLEVLAEDVEGLLTNSPEAFITVEWPVGQRRTVRLEDFNQLAKHPKLQTMDDILKEKAKEQRRQRSEQTTQARRRGRQRSGSRRFSGSPEKIDYTSWEWMGVPHRGRIPPLEIEGVKNDPQQANRNRERENKKRQAEGKPPYPPLDADHPKELAKYGLRVQDLVEPAASAPRSS